MSGGVRWRFETLSRGTSGVLYGMVVALAEYERVSSGVVASEEDLRRGLFGDEAIAEAAIAWEDGTPIGFAVWYQTFSTFRGGKGIYV